jgi:hypothetical protein
VAVVVRVPCDQPIAVSPCAPCVAAEAAPPGVLELDAEAAARPSRPESLLIAPPPSRPRHRSDRAGTMRPPAPECDGSGPITAGAMVVRPAPRSLPVSARSPRRGPAAAVPHRRSGEASTQVVSGPEGPLPSRVVGKSALPRWTRGTRRPFDASLSARSPRRRSVPEGMRVERFEEVVSDFRLAALPHLRRGASA